jgi:flavodoxin
MKILIAYYSRTNITRNVAKKIQKELNCDIEEIKDTKNRSGMLNYIKSGFDAIRAKNTKIKPITKDPSHYDLTIIATPVWAGTMASPILTYITENKEKFTKVSFISTCNSTCEKTLENMENLLNKQAIETMTINKEDIDQRLNQKINEFSNKIAQNN